ncbi:efflux RND transporter periplasmic adaptor subunit [Candidatus Riflebacteria bacterium]
MQAVISKMDIFKNVFGVVFILFLIVFQGGLFSQDRIKPGYSAVSYAAPAGLNAVTAKKIEVDRIYEESAIVTTKRKADISPRVMGVILEINVAAGEVVEKGQSVARIDSEQLVVKLEQAKKGLAAARTAQKQAQQYLNGQKAALVQAEKNYKRILQYKKKKAATAQQLETAEASFKTMKAQVAGAVQGIRISEIEMEKAVKSVEEARIAISYTTLNAPFKGIVTIRHHDPGDMAIPGRPIVTINDTSKYQLEAHLRESAREFVTAGMEIDIRVGKQKLKGIIEEITPRIDPNTRTFRIKVGFLAAKNIFLGMYGKVFIPRGKQRVIFIPRQAIQKIGQIDTVLIKQKDEVVRRYIKTGFTRDDGLVEIRSGLKENEIILFKKGSE